MVIVMIIGILFASHVYYHALGGQGFLKAKRHGVQSKEKNSTQLYLPMRKLEIVEQGKSFWRQIGRSPKNIPFYTCGDQLNSCETFDQPDICCPVTMACYRVKFTPSGIACCNSSANQFDCEPSEDNPPICIEGTVQCSEATGGGCCPSASECSPNGCIHVVSASILDATPTSSDLSGADSEVASQTSSATRNSVSAAGTPLSTVTVTQRPAATQTLAKAGEVMQARGTRGSVVMTLCVPYSTACLLVGVAALMGLL
ncbi:hypothetical protein BKA65DRAFT_593811 [Rhexocercosporidium sp. MPI-PUGE-AT-0058]|nr:hypothetical protein BKA65DRAFT_593811 [Rhexocercosporidium sp. MPI-PUGE-AT-0058]